MLGLFIHHLPFTIPLMEKKFIGPIASLFTIIKEAAKKNKYKCFLKP